MKVCNFVSDNLTIDDKETLEQLKEIGLYNKDKDMKDLDLNDVEDKAGEGDEHESLWLMQNELKIDRIR